ncbi:type II toxin-antitoxin system VapC family toxin [soil metagenome]
MRFLLDTNVLSEGSRRQPDRRVAEWIRGRSPLDLAISVLTVGEILKGIHTLPPGKRRDELELWLDSDLPHQFRNRILPIDEPIARIWGRLSGEGRRAGRPLPIVDGLLLATAMHHDLTLVTRNESDFEDRGVVIVNPWRD